MSEKHDPESPVPAQQISLGSAGSKNITQLGFGFIICKRCRERALGYFRVSFQFISVVSPLPGATEQDMFNITGKYAW